MFPVLQLHRLRHLELAGSGLDDVHGHATSTNRDS